MKKQPRLDLNPSSADRWTTCTASPQFILDNWDRVPDSTSVFNQEGTTAHEVASAILENRKPREHDKYYCPTAITGEMRWHGWNYSEYVNDLASSFGHRLLVEQKMPLWYMPGRNAIVDAAVVNDHSLHVIDYKYGEGIVVSTERNLQAIIYAYSIGRDLDLPEDFPVSLHIYQPRGRAAEDSPFHRWDTTWKEIDFIAWSIGEKAKQIIIEGCFPEHPNLKFKPSEKACQWCPAKGFCGARTQLLTEGIKPLEDIGSELTELPRANALSLEQISKIIKYGPQIKKFISDAEDFAFSHMVSGGKIPGFKIVQGRDGNRYWKDPVRAGKLLEKTILREDEIYEKKVIGPAQVEKKLGKEKLTVELTNLIGRPTGKPTIAPEGDKRESCLIEAASEFTNLDEF